jgi:phosphoglycerol transferase MdoB-like AlkP superfamily enzyme
MAWNYTPKLQSGKFEQSVYGLVLQTFFLLLLLFYVVIFVGFDIITSNIFPNTSWPTRKRRCRSIAGHRPSNSWRLLLAVPT